MWKPDARANSYDEAVKLADELNEKYEVDGFYVDTERICFARNGCFGFTTDSGREWTGLTLDQLLDLGLVDDEDLDVVFERYIRAAQMSDLEAYEMCHGSADMPGPGRQERAARAFRDAYYSERFQTEDLGQTKMLTA